VSLRVVFLPDTALLVPGAGGAADPAAGLRAAALGALGAGGTGERALVVAPGRRTRVLPHPAGLGLGAAGLDLARSGDAASDPGATGGTGTDLAVDGPARPALRVDRPVPPALRADVAASTALVLLRAAGVHVPVDVVELGRAAAEPAPLERPADGVGLLVVVGSPSARHGPEAPLADDPRAPAADAALLAALGEGPAALADALDALGPDGAADLAVTGAGPWRAALRLLPDAAVVVTTLRGEVLAGAQHAVAAWAVTATTSTATTSTAPEEPR
jgi:hypothetical protein